MRDDVWLRWGGRVPHFVGRDEEWRALDAALERASRFQAPQFVTVVGALGSGKTRLLAEWVSELERVGEHRVVHASVARDGRPLSLVGALLRSRFGIDDAMDAGTARTLFRNQLQVVFGDRRVAEVAGLLGRFLGFESPESPLGLALSGKPEQEAELARAVLCRFLEDDALLRPLVIAVDDLHAADDASLDLLTALAGELGEAALLVVATARPELYVRRPEWGRGEGAHTRIELAPLSAGELGSVLSSALAVVAPSAALAERALAESGGNPYLLAEVLGAYHDRGVLVSEGDGRWAFDADSAALPLALAPEASAHGRVAELSPAERDLLARATVFGPVFWTGGVIALGRLGGHPPDPTTVFAPDRAIEETRRMLASLEDRGYVLRMSESTIPGESEWAFCESRERDMVAATVDPELARRRRLFAAQWLEGRTPLDQISDRFELLATLYESAADERRAGECYVAAGDRAMAERRHERARVLYLRGVQLLDLADSVFKMDALHKLGDVAARVGRSREALAHFAEMLRIAWRLDLPAKGGAAHARIGRLHRTLGDLKLARKHLELARLLFELAGDLPGTAATLDDLGRVHLLAGQIDEARRHHGSALALRDELDDQRGRALTLSWLGLCEAHAGELAEALGHFRSSLAIYRDLHDERGLALTLGDLAAVEAEAGRTDRARALLEEATRLARRISEPLAEATLSVRLGEAFLAAARPRDAARELAAARQVAQRFGARRLLSECERALAEVELALGQVVTARHHAETALELAEKVGAPRLVGAALRVLATTVIAGAPADPDRGGPREMLDRATEVLGAVGAELELGRVLCTYADYEERGGRISVASALRGQATQIRVRAFGGPGGVTLPEVVAT